MAPPLSKDLPLSPELRSVFDCASSLASQEEGPVGSVHLLVAIYSVPNQALHFLQSHRASAPHAGWTTHGRHEAPSMVDRIWERSHRLASTQRAESVDSMHLLGAILRESSCYAYRMLEAGGLDVSGIRTRTMSPQAAIEAPAASPPSGPAHRPSIGFHPQLGAPRRERPKRSGRTRSRALLKERTSPVHPALRERWLSTTPGEGLPAIIPPTPAPSHETLDERGWVPERVNTGSFIPPSGLRQSLEARLTDTSSAAELDPPPHPTGSYKSLKERFAELKQQARKRRRPTGEFPAVPSDKVLPPTVRRISRALPAVKPDAIVEPSAPVEPAEPAIDDQVRAIDDAKQATRSLAARMFGRVPASDPPEPEPSDSFVPSPAEDASDMIECVEVTDATITPETRAAHAPARRTRPDPALAATYRLDPSEYPLLSKLGRNLTEEAALMRIDQAIGRDQEITALMDILGKRRGNNPLLLGDPGVGKTAIAEGLAHRFADLASRDNRLGRRAVIELELGRLLSGTHLRGSLSERLIELKEEVRRAQGNVIVFLDEIHAWLGAGQGGDGNDAAGELKTALARGVFPCIGATTQDEYTKFIEDDPAFQRRFQIIHVEEPDITTAVAIARGVREHYEGHHGVTYADAAIEAAVRLSQRYLHDRRLPDKALNVLDMAGSRAARTSRNYVRRTDIARVVAQMANLPCERLTHSDRERFLDIERALSDRVIGHGHVIHRTAEVLRRNYAGFRSQRPIGSMLFLGPTGVGKTELVKALADFLFHDRDAIVRLDMSEFMEAHSTSRMIGAPPGYVGHDQGGQLTEAIRRRPYQVVLLDEIEKAHPDVLNLLLQLFDEGRLTDGRGRTVDFSNTLIIMTSNLGSHVFDQQAVEESRGRIGFDRVLAGATTPAEDRRALEAEVLQVASSHFTPELWNRMDERLVFMPLGREEVAQIAVLQLEDSAARLEQESGISLDFSDDVIAHLISHGGYDRRLGARPMRHTIQRLIEGRIARMILSGEVRREQTLLIDVDPEDFGQLLFRLVDEPA